MKKENVKLRHALSTSPEGGNTAGGKEGDMFDSPSSALFEPTFTSTLRSNSMKNVSALRRPASSSSVRPPSSSSNLRPHSASPSLPNSSSPTSSRFGSLSGSGGSASANGLFRFTQSETPLAEGVFCWLNCGKRQAEDREL